MTAVVLKDMALTRGTTPILRGVNLRVEPGEFCVFVGPSGCGKSTLLRLIAGLDEDASGELFIDGAAVNNTPAAKRNVAMVFQGYALYPHMTVEANMAFALRRAGMGKAEIAARLREAARALHLEEFLQRKPAMLSGGQRQRVAIARAIVKKPKVFLFDEPLSNLDASLRVETRIEIARLHRQLGSASMLYVTHDQVEAMTLADKIVLLQPLGQDPLAQSIVQVGRPMELYHQPANLFAARFIGTPAMNLFETRVLALDEPEGVAFELQGQRLHAAVDPAGLSVGEPVTVGIRPEHVLAYQGGLGATVTHIEALGELSVLFTQMEGVAGPLLAKTTREDLRVGDSLPVHLPSQALHLFRGDGRAQRRLRARTV